MATSSLTAAEARENTLKAQSQHGEFLRTETDALLTKIAVVSKQGQSELNADRLDIVIENRLRTLGYKVKWTDGYDQRDPGYTTISW